VLGSVPTLGREPGVSPVEGRAKSTDPGRLPGVRFGVLGRVEGREAAPPPAGREGALGRLIEGERLIGAEGRDMPPEGRDIPPDGLAIPPPPPPTRPPPPPPPRPPPRAKRAELGVNRVSAIKTMEIACWKSRDMILGAPRGGCCMSSFNPEPTATAFRKLFRS
jgi:hypothetical protein